MGESSATASPSAGAVAAGEWLCPTCGSKYPADFAVCPRDATPRAETDASASDPMLGAVVGNTYRVTKLIGEGGMARLYQAEHLRVEARFAAKVIHRDLAGDPDMIARFEREARAAGRIHSDHVVRVIDVLRTPLGRPCIITELLDGEDLQARLDRVGKMSASEAVPIARQICRAVAAAHAVGVVHRDLKPSNVFLCRGDGIPMVKVFDFGVAKIDDDEKLTRTDAVVGTAAYMAPEQARKAADAGPGADIYSIGAVIYHMLAGEPPYGSAPALSRFALLLHEEPARPRELEPSIPAAVEAVIQHAMARDPKVRVATADELELELEALAVPPMPATPASTAAATPASSTTRSSSGSGTASSSGSTSTAAARAITGGMPTLATSPNRSTGTIATDLALRAKIARPLAGFLTVASSLAAGAWVATLLAVLIGVRASGGERSLIGLIAAGTVAGVAAIQIRMLRPRWRSSPAVLRVSGPVQRGLIAAVLVFGALELVAHATVAVLHTEVTSVGSRVVLAGLAGVVGLVWQRFGWDERFKRWLG